MNKFVGLIILDGFGLREEERGNAIKVANPVNFNKYFSEYPSTCLNASGKSVGLPEGQMGNSEVGHLHIGSGRIIFQSLQRINNAVENGEFFSNKSLLNTMQHAVKYNSTLHIMGLLSDGGVHSNISHLFALLKMAYINGVKKVAIHAFLDGRDTPIDSGLNYLNLLLKELKKYPTYKLATLMGRFYAMDREQNYNYTQMAYNAIVSGVAECYAKDAITALKQSYSANVMDEFVKPIVFTEDDKVVSKVSDNDAIIHFNFREDRARQLTASLVENFDIFKTEKCNNVNMCTFTCYDEKFVNPIVAFPKDDLSVNLSAVLSSAGLKQFKIAETTKYAHVTYFMNGGNEQEYEGEDRVLIDTLKNVPFEQVPYMRAKEITDEAIKAVKSKRYNFMALNYSNPDMIGHTGSFSATVQAIKEVDNSLARLVDAILKVNGVAVVIADHGNAEYMIDEEGNKVTSHTTNPVPFILVSKPKMDIKLRKNGGLANIAPTILELLDVAIPAEFAEPSLICN